MAIRNGPIGTFVLADKTKYRPSFFKVDDIKLVIKHADYVPDGQIVPFLDTLEKHVAPSETLLFLTSWKDGEEKQPIPYWLPERSRHRVCKRGALPRISCNVPCKLHWDHAQPSEALGVQGPRHSRSIFRENGRGGTWRANGPSGTSGGDRRAGEQCDAVLRGTQVTSPGAIFRFNNSSNRLQESPADGLFLDQAFLIFNDGNGTVDDFDYGPGKIWNSTGKQCGSSAGSGPGGREHQ